MNCDPYRRRVLPLSLVIVSTYSYVDTILPSRHGEFKMTSPDGYQLEAAIVEGRLVRAAEIATDANAQARSLTRRALTQQLRGDLGAVLDKALRLEPAQRYTSAIEMAEDLRRYLRGHPVQAARTTPWQRAWKFTRRHRLSVAVSGLAVISLVGLTIAALWQAREAQMQRAKTEASLEATDAVVFFLGNVFLTDALAAGNKQAMTSVVKQAERIARAEFAGFPETLSRVLFSISVPYGDNGDFEKAFQLVEEARALTQDPVQRRSTDCWLGYVYSLRGKYPQALPLLEGVANDPGAKPLLRALCSFYLSKTLVFGAGDMDGALRAADDAMRYWRSMKQPTPILESWLLQTKAGILMSTSRVAEADGLFKLAAESSQRLGRDRGMSHAILLNDWALASFISGQLVAAQALQDEALALNRQNAGPSGVWPVFLLNAALYRLEAGLYDDALDYYDQALAAARAYGYSAEAASAQCLGAVALLRTSRGSQEAAQTRWAAGNSEKLVGNLSDRAAKEGCGMAAAQLALRRGDAAEALRRLDALLGAPKLRESSRGHMLQWRSRAQLALGNTEAAQTDAEAALKIARQLQGAQPHSFRTALALDALARQQAATHQSNAPQTRRETDAALTATVAPSHWLRQ